MELFLSFYNENWKIISINSCYQISKNKITVLSSFEIWFSSFLIIKHLKDSSIYIKRGVPTQSKYNKKTIMVVSRLIFFMSLFKVTKKNIDTQDIKYMDPKSLYNIQFLCSCEENYIEYTTNGTISFLKHLLLPTHKFSLLPFHQIF